MSPKVQFGVPPLRQAATAAYAERRQRQADAEAESLRALTAKVRRQFVDDFDCQPDYVEGVLVKVKDAESRGEELALRAIMRSDDHNLVQHWEVWGYCPKCKAEDWSLPVRDLADLGEMLTDFRHSEKNCPYSQKFEA